MTLSVRLKLLANLTQLEILTRLVSTMNRASTATAAHAHLSGVFTRVPLHHLCYQWLRDTFGLVSNHAICVIGSVASAFAKDRNVCPEFRQNAAVPLSTRLYKIFTDVVKITTLDGRITIPFECGDRYRHLLSKPLGEARLLRDGDHFYLIITVTVSEPPIISIQDVLGVDLGIVNLATTSEGEFFSGQETSTARKRHARARQTYQRRGTRNSRRRLRKLARRQARCQRHCNHVIAKRLVAQAKALHAGIALEDLKYIRERVEKTVSLAARRAISNWGFSHLQHCINYKARLAGVPVVYVDPRNTSKTCHRCGYCSKENRPSQAVFRCQACGWEGHADHNGACTVRALGATTLCPHSTAS